MLYTNGPRQHEVAAGRTRKDTDPIMSDALPPGWTPTGETRIPGDPSHEKAMLAYLSGQQPMDEVVARLVEMNHALVMMLQREQEHRLES